MLRFIKIIAIALVAVWAFMGAFFNIIDWAGTTGAVGAAASMSTFEGGADSWQATSNPLLILAASVMIVITKTTAGVLCAIGAMQMWGARKSDAETFARSKALALSGCFVFVLMLFAGWIILAETWFEMWRSDVMRDLALGAAFRYAGFVGLIALFVGARND